MIVESPPGEGVTAQAEIIDVINEVSAEARADGLAASINSR